MLERHLDFVDYSYNSYTSFRLKYGEFFSMVGSKYSTNIKSKKEKAEKAFKSSLKNRLIVSGNKMFCLSSYCFEDKKFLLYEMAVQKDGLCDIIQEIEKPISFLYGSSLVLYPNKLFVPEISRGILRTVVLDGAEDYCFVSGKKRLGSVMDLEPTEGPYRGSSPKGASQVSYTSFHKKYHTLCSSLVPCPTKTSISSEMSFKAHTLFNTLLRGRMVQSSSGESFVVVSLDTSKSEMLLQKLLPISGNAYESGKYDPVSLPVSFFLDPDTLWTILPHSFLTYGVTSKGRFYWKSEGDISSYKYPK